MSKKTNPEVDEELDLDDAGDDAEDALDLDEVDDADDEPAPAKRPAKKSGSTSKRPTKSASRRNAGKSGKSAFVTGGKKPGGKPAKSGRGGRGGRGGHLAPVKVAGNRPWGTIALFTVVILLFTGIVGYTFWEAYKNDLTPQERANLISGVKDYSSKVKGAGDHKPGDLTYPQKPPVGGTHNGIWQNCMGNIYNAPIADEHAVHSLEHGAIWITYQPGLPKDQIDQLKERVEGKDHMMLSQHSGQPTKISVQAWGFQLQLDDADDSRIDDFIQALRGEGPEKGASCSEGITVTGDQPREVEAPQQPQPGAPGGAPAAPPGG
ncbi:MAG: DUF3105 domain-containing protein [Micromonosporaceae bacterium]